MICPLTSGVNEFIVSIITKRTLAMKTIGRPREFDRESALHAAMLLFWKKGFLASSMTDLCDAMGIRSPSLYGAFGSKESLYVEAVDRYNAAARMLIWGHIDDEPTVRSGMRKVLSAAAQVMTGTAGGPTGCLVTFAAGEAAASDLPSVTRDARLDSLAILRTGLARAQNSGELSSSVNVDGLARFYLGVVQGMAVQARDGASLEQLEGMVETAMSAWPTGR